MLNFFGIIVKLIARHKSFPLFNLFFHKKLNYHLNIKLKILSAFKNSNNLLFRSTIESWPRVFSEIIIFSLYEGLFALLVLLKLVVSEEAVVELDWQFERQVVLLQRSHGLWIDNDDAGFLPVEVIDMRHDDSVIFVGVLGWVRYEAWLLAHGHAGTPGCHDLL